MRFSDIVFYTALVFMGIQLYIIHRDTGNAGLNKLIKETRFQIQAIALPMAILILAHLDLFIADTHLHQSLMNWLYEMEDFYGTPWMYLFFIVTVDMAAYTLFGWWKPLTWMTMKYIWHACEVLAEPSPKRESDAILPLGVQPESPTDQTVAAHQFRKDKEVAHVLAVIAKVQSSFKTTFVGQLLDATDRMMKFRVGRPANIQDVTLRNMQDSVIAQLNTDGAYFELQKNKHLYFYVPRKSQKGKTASQLVGTFDQKLSPAAMLVGETDNGTPLWFCPVKEEKHLLEAGASGSGKTTHVLAMLGSILMRMPSPDQVKFLMIDTKRVGLTRFGKLPHMLAPVATEYEDAREIMVMAKEEMMKRYRFMETQEVMNFSMDLGFPVVLLIIDELADIAQFDVLDDLARQARGAGIYIIAAIQNPERKIVNSQINTNMVARVCLQVEKAVDSKTVLDQQGAENLTQKGEFLFKRISSEFKGVQHGYGPFISDTEINALIKRNGGKSDNQKKINPVDHLKTVMDMYDGDEQSISATKIRAKLGVGAKPAGRIRDLARIELGLPPISNSQEQLA